MKPEAKLKKIQDQITEAKKNPVVVVRYHTYDESVQAELRLSALWGIEVVVDAIGYPKDLSGENAELWKQMAALSWNISRAAILAEKDAYPAARIKISERLKDGPARRAEAKTAWLIESGKAFLAEYRKVAGKANLARVRKAITALQAEQKALLPQLRAANSAVVMGRKTAKAEQARINAEALKSGEFWKADKDALKGYFHPPFDKNYLADVAKKWRAALFLECQSVSFKLHSGDWGHKLVGTGRGYLCGIDDNGDEWGYTIAGLPQSHDTHGNAMLDTSIEEAMGEIFSISTRQIPDCLRQGDLLFCPVTIPGERMVCVHCGAPYTERDQRVFGVCIRCGMDRGHKTLAAPVLHPAATWTPRESHQIDSPTLSHNGAYFRAADPITVTHTSHATVVLPAGEYRLYMSRLADPVD